MLVATAGVLRPTDSRYQGHRSQNFTSKQLARHSARQGPFWTITEVFQDQKSSRRLHQGHRSLSFMSQSEQEETPSADCPSHFARLRSSVTRDQDWGHHGQSHHGHLPAPAFSLLAITQPSLLCVAVATGLFLVYIGDCIHSSNGQWPLPQPLPPHTMVEVKPNICCQVSAEVKTTSGLPILKKLHQLFENSGMVPVLKKKHRN